MYPPLGGAALALRLDGNGNLCEGVGGGSGIAQRLAVKGLGNGSVKEESMMPTAEAAAHFGAPTGAKPFCALVNCVERRNQPSQGMVGLKQKLVGGLEHLLLSYILGIVIPTIQW